MDYGWLFSRAWAHCWHHKFLIVLGFLAALGSSSALGSGINSPGEESLPPGLENSVEHAITEFLNSAEAQIPAFIALGCFLFVLALILWLVRLVAQAGLINAVDQLERGEKVSFGTAMAAGMNYLARMVGLNVVLFLPLWLIGIAISFFLLLLLVNVMARGESASLGAAGQTIVMYCLCLFTLACLALPLFIATTLIYPFAQRGIVLRNLGVVPSIQHGWEVIKQNTADVILLAVMFIVFQVIVGLVISLLLLPFNTLANNLMLEQIVDQAFDMRDLLFMIGTVLLLLPAGALFYSLFAAYRSATVTLFYGQVVERPEAAF